MGVPPPGPHQGAAHDPRDGVLERVGRLRPDTRTVLNAAAVLSGLADYARLVAHRDPVRGK